MAIDYPDRRDVAPLTNELAQTVLGFRVGELGFLLPASLHCEVIERLPVNPIPNVEPWFSGLLNIRGNIVPVVDLHCLLGANPGKKRYLFAVDRGDKTVALWIDGYPQILTGPDHSLQVLEALPILPERLQRYVTGAYLCSGQAWLSLQFGQLFKALGRGHTAKETA
ncbi:MAG: hypothetical protein EPN89_10165 [Methylovulum sp.]|nr:MAG: hypothetical protein EPN89_10165 [Methylovulum sp.]